VPVADRFPVVSVNEDVFLSPDDERITDALGENGFFQKSEFLFGQRVDVSLQRGVNREWLTVHAASAFFS
jgi:hypothetical protein